MYQLVDSLPGNSPAPCQVGLRRETTRRSHGCAEMICIFRRHGHIVARRADGRAIRLATRRRAARNRERLERSFPLHQPTRQFDRGSYCARLLATPRTPELRGIVGHVPLQLSKYVRAVLQLDITKPGDVHEVRRRFGTLEASEWLSHLKSEIGRMAAESESALRASATTQPDGEDVSEDLSSFSDDRDRELKWQRDVHEAATTDDENAQLRLQEELQREHALLVWFVKAWDEAVAAGKPLDELVEILNVQLEAARPVITLDPSGRATRTWQANSALVVRGTDVMVRAWAEVSDAIAMDETMSRLASTPTSDAGQRKVRALRAADRDALMQRMLTDEREGMSHSEIAEKYKMPKSTVGDRLRRARRSE